jgi:glycosyltransferase involved in cell wall biosynthesis
MGARVIQQAMAGYIAAVKSGFSMATGQIVVTLDGDGEHMPKDIPRLVQPILLNEADMVLGMRRRIARVSERLISLLCRMRLPVHDTGTGFRAIRRDLAVRLSFPGRCICGTSVLEAYALGARIVEVPINLNTTDKPRRIAWGYIVQLFYVIKMLLY